MTVSTNANKRSKRRSARHSSKYSEDIDSARHQIQNAEENMKRMDAEEREFHAHMAQAMRELMATFSTGYQALEHAKTDERLSQRDDSGSDQSDEADTAVAADGMAQDD